MPTSANKTDLQVLWKRIAAWHGNRCNHRARRNSRLQASWRGSPATARDISTQASRVAELPEAGVTGAVDGKQLTKLVLCDPLAVTIGSCGCRHGAILAHGVGREGRGTLLWSGGSHGVTDRKSLFGRYGKHARRNQPEQAVLREMLGKGLALPPFRKFILVFSPGSRWPRSGSRGR